MTETTADRGLRRAGRPLARDGGARATGTTAGGGSRRTRLVQLRPADVTEIVAIAGISAPTSRLRPGELARDGRLWLGLRDAAGALVAVAGAVDAAGDAHVVDVAVRPDCRRAGLATRLVAALLAGARDELGSTAATLEVRASDAAARALYRRLGFTVAGRRPSYYPPATGGTGREDAIVMWRDDLTGAAVRLAARDGRS